MKRYILMACLVCGSARAELIEIDMDLLSTEGTGLFEGQELIPLDLTLAYQLVGGKVRGLNEALQVTGPDGFQMDFPGGQVSFHDIMGLRVRTGNNGTWEGHDGTASLFIEAGSSAISETKLIPVSQLSDLDPGGYIAVGTSRLFVQLVGWDRRAYVDGDVTRDGLVNQLDLVSLLQSDRYKDTATWSQGDWTGDGRFNQNDIVHLLRSGVYMSPPAYAATVPEPSTWFLLTFAGVALVLVRVKDWPIVRRFLHREEGATLTEYALLVGLIAVPTIAAITALGLLMSGFFEAALEYAAGGGPVQ